MIKWINLLSEFLVFVESSETDMLRVRKLESEVVHLQEELLKSQREIKSLEVKLKNARLLLDQEKQEKRFIEREKNDMVSWRLIKRKKNDKEVNWMSKERHDELKEVI